MVLRIFFLFLLLFQNSLEDTGYALKQLAKKLDALFQQQSRINFVKQNLLSQFNGSLKVQKFSPTQVRQTVRKQLEKYARLKIEALRRLVEKAELSLRFNNYEFKSVMTEEECEVARREARLSDARYFEGTRLQTSYGRSVIHIAVDSYICDNAVWKDFLWTKSNQIKEAFVQNAATDKTLKTQYIATNSGLTRIYPPRKWRTEPEAITVDLFDPRYRPWYIAAQSAPKDVLFLIDMSGSVKGQTIHLIRMTILHILTTLGPNDYMNAIWFNTHREFALHGCSNGFIPATTLNKKILREHLNHLEERDQAILTPALEMGFKVFSGGKLNVSKFWEQNGERTSGGHKLIMLFTDFDEEHPTSIFENYDPTLSDNPIKIFGFSMGFGTGPLSVLNYLACRTNGGHFVVDSVSDVRHQAINYLIKLSELLYNAYFDQSLNSRPVSWSNLMMDVQGGGPVLTLSMPILSAVPNNSRIVAVAGVDMELQQLIKMLPNNDQIYSFIVDNNGIVIYHPKLKLPKTELYAVRRLACFDYHTKHGGSKVQFTQTDENVLRLMGLFDSIPTLDIRDLERNTVDFLEFRKAMIDRNCSDKLIVDNDREYLCSAIEGTPLVVGFVISKKTAFILDATVKKPKRFNSNLVGFFIADQHICDGAINKYGISERFDVLMSSNMCDDDLNYMNALVAASKQWILSWPKLDPDTSCTANSLPSDFDPFYHILSFINTPTGFAAFYPNWYDHKVFPSQCVNCCSSSKPMRSALKAFEHQRAPNDFEGEKLFLVPTFLKPPTIIGYKSIYDPVHRKHLASVGVIWTPSFLTDYFRNLTLNTNAPNASDWNICYGPKRCYLITETGHVVAGYNSERHLASLDVFVLHELVKRSYAMKWTDLDNQARCPPARWNFYFSNASSPKPYSIITILFRLTKLLTSTFWMDFMLILKAAIQDVQSQPIPIDDHQRCVYSDVKHDELCTLEYPNYQIRVNQTQYFFVNTGKCMRDVRILPVPGVSLYLFVMQKPCENETVSETLKKQYLSSTRRVPDCKRTANLYRRQRSDLDYTRSHPEEPQTPCSSSSKIGVFNLLTVIFLQVTFLCFVSFFQ